MQQHHCTRRYRKNGITQLKEGTEFENQRLRRIRRKNELRRKLQQQDSLGVPEPASPALSIKSEDMSNGGSPVMFTGSGAAMSPAAPKEEKVRSASVWTRPTCVTLSNSLPLVVCARTPRSRVLVRQREETVPEPSADPSTLHHLQDVVRTQLFGYFQVFFNFIVLYNRDCFVSIAF